MKTAHNPDQCVVTSGDDNAPFRLFCFPFAGGGASAFRQWSPHLPDKFQICAVQPPGRENRIMETPRADVRTLIDVLLPELEPFLDRPHVFLGHSTGALVAFEIIRELRRRTQPLPLHLVVSGSRAPHIPEPFPLHDLPHDEFIQGLKRFSGTPEIVLENQELMELFVPILRADLAIEETYKFYKEAPLNIPISAFYGTEDTEAPQTVVSPWNDHTSCPFSEHAIQGGHFFIKSNMDSFLSQISKILKQIHSQNTFLLNV